MSIRTSLRQSVSELPRSTSVDLPSAAQDEVAADNEGQGDDARTQGRTCAGQRPATRAADWLIAAATAGLRSGGGCGRRAAPGGRSVPPPTDASSASRPTCGVDVASPPASSAVPAVPSAVLSPVSAPGSAAASSSISTEKRLRTVPAESRVSTEAQRQVAAWTVWQARVGGVGREGEVEVDPSGGRTGGVDGEVEVLGQDLLAPRAPARTLRAPATCSEALV